VDDASTDASRACIEEVVKEHPEIIFLPLSQNGGNCAAFNHGFTMSKGRFIIDLATDDVLLPERVEEGVRALTSPGERYDVNFSDAELMDEDGRHLGFHSDRFPHETIPQGDIYQEVIRRYFINSPTMLIRREVLERLGGYDETLAYEDFDFWVRSARWFRYCYTPKPLVRRRIVATSMARAQYRKNSAQLVSTFCVCEKARLLNRTAADRRALKYRVLYEMRRAALVGEIALALRYFRLWQAIRRR
jgi:glycosyltransferase involved in cell wall biosynthesis